MAEETPRSLQAEEAVLGSLLIDPEAIHQVDFLKAQDFYLLKHQQIFAAIRDLTDRRVAVDFATVGEALAAREQLEGIGGTVYLSELIGRVPSAIHIETYARSVMEMKVRRGLLAAAGEIARHAYDYPTDLDTLMDRAESALFRVRQSTPDDRMRNAAQLANEVWAILEAAQGGAPLVYPTGYPEIDAILGGLYRQGLYIIAARTGLGKTSWLLNVAYGMVKRGLHAAVFSLEMSAAGLVQRLLVQSGCVRLPELRAGRIRDDQYPALVAELGALAERNLHIDDTPALSVARLRAKAVRLAMAERLDAVFVDYVQLMTVEARTDRRYEEIGHITRGLKNLSKELDIPVIAAAQLSRNAEGIRPTLSHLRESGDLEQDADGVLFLFRRREAEGTEQITEAIIAKNRHGPTGTTELIWVPDRAAFTSIVGGYVMP